jgi:hypothetical protein
MEAPRKLKPYVNRNSIRYVPEQNTMAWVDHAMESADFKPLVAALIFSESFRGCGLVMIDTKKVRLDVGSICRVKIGDLTPLEAEVRWREQLQPDVVKLGILFKDS